LTLHRTGRPQRSLERHDTLDRSGRHRARPGRAGGSQVASRHPPTSSGSGSPRAAAHPWATRQSPSTPGPGRWWATWICS